MHFKDLDHLVPSLTIIQDEASYHDPPNIFCLYFTQNFY